ncbi:alanine racemase C-terminal domain-containing protein [Cupriavidus sp. 8B]
MTLQSKILAVQKLRAGQSMSYGSRYVAPDMRRIGIVAPGSVSLAGSMRWATHRLHGTLIQMSALLPCDSGYSGTRSTWRDGGCLRT